MKINRSLWWRQQLGLVLMLVGFGLLVGVGWGLARQQGHPGSGLTNSNAPAAAQLAEGLRVAER
jgi:hypothetical protein